MRVTIYVEGGGDQNDVRTRCRRGFRLFLERAGFRGKMPGVVACGNRHEAISKFREAIRSPKDDEFPLLLVDSERPVRAEHEGDPWAHLQAIEGPDRLTRPDGAAEDQAHLMVQCMESWFLADRQRLVEFFGKGFQGSMLPNVVRVESVAKRRVLDGLSQAARNCRKRGYEKGAHSFEILEELAPARVEAASPHAKRFLDMLRERSGAS